MGRRHRPTHRPAAHRPHRRGDQCGVQPRRHAHRLRQRRQDGAAVGRRHRPTRRRSRSPATPTRCDSVAFSPDGHAPRLRQRRQDGAAVGRRHRPTRRPAAHRPHRRGVQRGVQPRRARASPPAAATTRCGCGTPTPANPSASRSPATRTRCTAWRSAPTGTRIASGSADKTVRVWDADTGQPIGAAAHRPHRTRCTAWRSAPTGTRIASGSVDKTVRLWDADTGQPVGQPLTGHTDAVYERGVQPRRARGSSPAASTRRCGCGTPTPANPSASRSPATPTRCTAWRSAPTGTRIVSGSDDKTVRLWDADTGQPIGAAAHRPHRRGVQRGVQPRRARGIASGSADKTVRLWDADTGQPVGQPLTGHTDAVSSVAFSPDGHADRLRQRRQDGAAVGRGHRPTHRRSR